MSLLLETIKHDLPIHHIQQDKNYLIFKSDNNRFVIMFCGEGYATLAHDNSWDDVYSFTNINSTDTIEDVVNIISEFI